jgi:phosphoglucomutase
MARPWWPEDRHRQWLVCRAPVGHREHLQDLRESFRDEAHLERIFAEAQEIVTRALKSS